MKILLLFLFIIFVAGCSNRAVYENLQFNKRTECIKLPHSQYDECMEGMNKSYDEYKRERDELIRSGD